MQGRNKYTIAQTVLSIFLVLLFSGCSAILEREFVVTSRHAEANTVNEDMETEQITDLDRFQTLLSEAVSQGAETLKVQLVYSEDPSQKLNELVSLYQRSDPVCAYAVQLISTRIVRILNYYEIQLDIKYQHTREEVESIITIENSEQYHKAVLEMMQGFEGTGTFLVKNYNASIYDFEAIFAEYYETIPSVAYGTAQVSVSIYPENGRARIIEANVQYQESTAELSSHAQKAESLALMFAGIAKENVRTDSQDSRVLALHDALCRLTSYDEGTASTDTVQMQIPHSDPYTAYGALARSQAVSTGYAMAFKLLCDHLDVECAVIHGRMGSENHSWNLVKLDDGNWYHVDVSLDDADLRIGYRFFGLSDAEMKQTHQWDSHEYEECTGTAGRTVLEGIEQEALEFSRLEPQTVPEPQTTTQTDPENPPALE